MAAFFATSSNERDSVPSQPSHSSYQESSDAGNVAYHGYASCNQYSDPSGGILHPLPATMLSQGSFLGAASMAGSPHSEQNLVVPQGDGRNETAFLQTMDGSSTGASDFFRNSMDRNPDMSSQAQLLVFNGQPMTSTMTHQGLSLSLCTKIPVPHYQYHSTGSDISFIGPQQSGAASMVSWAESNMRNMHTILPSQGNQSPANSVQNSKYLKAAQELLDEVVNVKNALKRKAEKNSECRDGDGVTKTEDKASKQQDGAVNSSAELSPSERQDLQNKVTSLLAMVDQVDRRYRHYYHQMQIVMSSFEDVAGAGAAKPYTALALQTISRHFRSLRDAIGNQIQHTRKMLGEEDTTSSKGSGISRLRYIDQQIRQQRAMQQFGMMQQHTWRPQRGLPESSVSILRAWLFEHFLHPYPKDSEKLMLARQTGLSRGQISNWFINARVRLWKPMIEDMYKEEFGESADLDSNSSSENLPKGKEEARSSEEHDELQSPSTERNRRSQLSSSSSFSKSEAMAAASMDPAGMPPMGAGGFDNSMMNPYTSLNLNHHRSVGHGIAAGLSPDAFLQPGGNGDRFITPYHVGELGGAAAYESSGVSLTLGLQNCNGGGGLPPVPEHQSLLAVRRGDGGGMYGNPADFDYMNNSEDRSRFGPSQLLHDFVA